MKKSISVIGSANCSEAEYKIATEVGAEIARKEGVLICGGLGGIMEAASKGAKDAGGETVGILPSADKECSNNFIDIGVVTGLGEARNIIVALSGDAVIAIGGELGTLSELCFAMKNKKPVIGIGTWELDKSYCSKVNMITAKTAKEAVDKAFSLIQ
ncbi:MAG: TIGR00725 family protein [Candidatus Omnitrophica bacterium]|nr:TIGR00725 family protein [Candidatus Omnitrophota bacterium]